MRSMTMAAVADEILQAGAPPFEALQATLIAAEALIAAGRLSDAQQRLTSAADALVTLTTRSSSTRVAGSADSRLASTQPAEPAPTMM